MLLLVWCLAMTTMMVGVGGELMEAHTFAAPFNDVQVDGKRFVSKYVDVDEGMEREGRRRRKENWGGSYTHLMFSFQLLHASQKVTHFSYSLLLSSSSSISYNNRDWSSGGETQVNQNFVRYV